MCGLTRELCPSRIVPMSGFSKVFFIGGAGPDGLSKPFVQLMQGEADRQWFEAIYADDTMKPMGGIQAMVPASPDHHLALLDAAIAFLPRHFEHCPSFSKVSEQVAAVTLLDFHLGQGVPAEWGKLRDEALQTFRQLNVFQADLKPLDVTRFGSD